MASFYNIAKKCEYNCCTKCNNKTITNLSSEKKLKKFYKTETHNIVSKYFIQNLNVKEFDIINNIDWEKT